MDKEPRSSRPRNQSAKTTSRGKTGSGGAPPSPGSAGPYINDRGEICFGNECFTVAVDTERKEVRLAIDRDSCGAEIQSVLDDMYTVLGRGAKTIYETRSSER